MLNLLNSTANIYVSVGQALRKGSAQSDGSRYHRPKHTYLISVEPHRLRIPGTPQHDTPLTHFEAITDPVTGDRSIATYSSRTAPPIIGHILVARSTQATVDKVRKALAEKFRSAREAEDAYADDEEEHHLRMHLHALRDHGLIAKFDIDEFISWTHGYAVERSSDLAPSLVTYPRAHKEHQRKAALHTSQTW